MSEEEKRPTSRKERQQAEMEQRIKKLSTLRGNESIYDIVGYPYREIVGAKRSSLPPVDNFLEDHELGLMYGPGKYVVVYKYVDPISGDEDGEQCSTISYQIGAEYAQLHRDHCQLTGQPCFLDSRAQIPGMHQQQESGLSSLLNEDKMKGIIGLLGAVKMLLGNNDNGGAYRDQLENQTKLLQAVLTRGQTGGNGISETLISTAFNRLLEPPRQDDPRKILSDQLELFSKFDALRNPEAARERQEQDEERMKSPIERMIDKAMDFLPVFLERFNGDERQAAIQLKKEHPEAKMMLASPKMRQLFYEAVCREHGQLSADKWAQGLGIDPSSLKAPAGRVAAPAQPAPAAQVQQGQGIKFR